MTVGADLQALLRRLKLGRMLDTLPERLVVARQQGSSHEDFLVAVLSDEVSRRDGNASVMRAQKAHLDADMQVERWDASAAVTYDKSMWSALVSLRFIEQHEHVALVGPVGVGKTFLAHALGHVACRHGYGVLAMAADKLLKMLRHARLDQTYEMEMRRLLTVDLLIIDDFALDSMDANESRDAHAIVVERHRQGSIIVTSNRGPEEWLATFADPMRAQGAIDRFISNAHELVIEGESYRKRLKPKLGSASPDALASGSQSRQGKQRRSR